MHLKEKKPRVFIFGSRGYANVVAETLFRSNCEIIGICGAAKGHAGKHNFKVMLANILGRLGLRHRDDFFFRDHLIGFVELSLLAQQMRARFFDIGLLRTNKFSDELKALRPDYIVSAGFPKLIPEELLNVASKVAFNLHPSLLPKHRGGTPSRWVVYFGDKETGVTAHVLDSSFDTGAILGRRLVKLGGNETFGYAENKIIGAMPELASSVVARWESGFVSAEAQDDAIATYEKPYRGRMQWLSWQKDALALERSCRAVQPRSGGLSRIGGKDVCLWDVKADMQNNNAAAPGTIIQIGLHGAIVQCGLGSLLVKTFLSFGQTIQAHIFLKRRKVFVGDCFEII